MMSVVPEDDTILSALKVGAKGFLSKDATSSELITAIKTVHKGEIWAERKLISKYFDELNYIWSGFIFQILYDSKIKTPMPKIMYNKKTRLFRSVI